MKNKNHLWQLYPRVLIGIWVVVSLALAAYGSFVEVRTVLPGPHAKEALLRYPGERIAFESGIAPTDALLLILRNPTFTVDSSRFKEATESLVALLRSQVVANTTTPLFRSLRTLGRGGFLNDRDLFVADDQHSLLLQALTDEPVFYAAKSLKDIPAAIEKWKINNSDFYVGYLSTGTASSEIFKLINEDLDRSLIFTLPLTLLILLWAFRSLIAACIPIFIALTSLFCSLGVTACLSHLWSPVSATAQQLVVLLVLAIGVDYSLFMLSRVREEVAHGADLERAVALASQTTGRAILWSGFTIACSLVGLLLMDDTILASMAIVSIIAVIITVISTTGVLPALLLVLGRFVAHSKSEQVRFRNLGVNHPRPVTLFCLAGLLALSTPIFWMRLGSTMEQDILPKGMQSSSAFERLRHDFPRNAGVSFSIVVRGRSADFLRDDLLDPFFEGLVSAHDVSGPLEAVFSKDGVTARYLFVAAGNGNLRANQQLVEKIRSEYVPKLLNPLGVDGYVTGVLPFVADEAARYRERTPCVFLAVLALSFTFLLVAFRSIVVPLKAIVLNLLSTSAAFGLLVGLFQAGVLPHWNYGVIESFVPALLFSILFGLSMDYHVFLIARIQEEALAGKSTRDAVSCGVASTYRTITSAAIIMTSVFLVIAALELPLMQQLGIGLAAAVFIDATIIRTMLLPASMVLLGGLNWYLPKWLRWLPRIGPH